MEKRKAHPVLHRIAVAVHVLVTVLSVIACAVGIYIHVLFPAEKLDELWFYLTGGVGEGGGEAVGKAAAILVVPCLAVSALLLFLQYGFRRRPVACSRTSRKTGKTRTFVFLPVHPKWLFTLISCLLLVGIGLGQVGAFSYLRASFSESEFLEQHYVDPTVPGRIAAPENKRNLILIELESMETSFFSREHGGFWDEDVIAELYNLLSEPDAVFFATDEGTHGTLNAFGSTWTTAALISYTSGLPFKVPVGKENSYHSKKFLSGAWTLGDVLQQNGYRNILVSGAETSFGGVAEYFTAHGGYTLVDVDHPFYVSSVTGKRQDFSVPKSQTNTWGFSDEATLRIAQKVLEAEAESSNEPWHLFISTIDTHFSGYLYEPGDGYNGSVQSEASRAERVYATTSREVYRFVMWLKEQPFYENTTVVIVGDHPNMQKGICGGVPADERGRYNLILNPVTSTDATKNRAFTAYDFYPTVLSSMGFRISTGRLGLGTDLFSGMPTLAEQYGMEKFNEELAKQSDFYIDRIMGRRDYEDLEG